MKSLISISLILCFTTLCGCRYQEPTNVSPINNSGKMVHGTLVIGQEHIPFAHLSNYAGVEKFEAGDLVEANLFDLWTGIPFQLRSKIPPRPTDDSFMTLLVELDKKLCLNVSWKTKPGSLEDIHFERFNASFECLPIVVANHGPRRGYLVRLKQGSDSYAFYRTEYNEQLEALNYGFILQGSEVDEGLLFVSYVGGPVLETNYFRLPNDLQSASPGVSALFIQVDQDKDVAKLYVLNNTSQNPRSVADELKDGKIELPATYIEVQSGRIDKEIRRDGFRLPDISLIE
jgi:hypothetical protein